MVSARSPVRIRIIPSAESFFFTGRIYTEDRAPEADIRGDPPPLPNVTIQKVPETS